MRTTLKSSIRVTAAAAIFTAGFLLGSITQRPAEAQLGDLKGKAMDAAGPAAELGTQLTDMKKNLDGLQKNYDMLKKVQGLLGG